MGFKALKGTVARVMLTSRSCVNPFGIVDSHGNLFTAQVVRGNLDKWVNFLAKNEFDDEFNRNQREARVTAMLSGVSNRVAAGMRQAQGQSTGQIIRQVAKDISRTYFDPEKLKEKEYKKKVGAAELFFIGGSNLDDENGGPLDFSDVKNRLDILCYEKDVETGQDILCTVEFLLNPDGTKMLDEDEMAAAAKLAGPDEVIEPIYMYNPWRFLTMGDAIFAWMEWEANKTAKFYEDEKDTIVKNSEPSPVGSQVNGLGSNLIEENPS